jgi:hypothetical protein
VFPYLSFFVVEVNLDGAQGKVGCVRDRVDGDELFVSVKARSLVASAGRHAAVKTP